MQPRSSLSELLNSLDAATYFFVSSGIFIAVTAALFFVLGIWLGRILWGRYKRRFREAEEVIEAFKGEVALLKRRIAEQSTRHSPGMGPSPLQSIAFKSVAPKATRAPLEMPGLTAMPPPPGRAFSIWTEPDWKPAKVKARKPPAAKGFSLWAEPPVKAAKPDAAGTATSKVPTTAELPLFSVMDAFMASRSRAFCIWTEKNWGAPLVRVPPLPAAQGFSIWTQPDFRPACRGALPPSQAHALWTAPGWAAPRHSGPPPLSARAFSVWTEPGWKPAEGVPQSIVSSAWTLPDFQLTGCDAVMPSQAGSIWTENTWTPTPLKPLPRVAAHPFSIWSEPPHIRSGAPTRAAHASQTSIVAAAAAAVASITGQPASDQSKGQGFMARALAAAKQALGISTMPALEPAPMPARTPEPAKVSVWPTPANPAAAASLAVTAAAVEALRLTGRVPVMSAPSSKTAGASPSKAFSVWTGDPTAPEPAKKITQRIALASLIESKVATGKVSVPPPQAAPVFLPPQVPPVPAVPVIVTALAPRTTAVPTTSAPTGTTQGAMWHDEKLGLLYAQEPPQKDMLSAIFSVDETMRTLLHKNGIYTFSQIAHWTPRQADAFSQRLGVGDRIMREDWIGQAKVLHQSKHGSSNGS